MERQKKLLWITIRYNNKVVFLNRLAGKVLIGQVDKKTHQGYVTELNVNDKKQNSRFQWGLKPVFGTNYIQFKNMRTDCCFEYTGIKPFFIITSKCDSTNKNQLYRIKSPGKKITQQIFPFANPDMKQKKIHANANSKIAVDLVPESLFEPKVKTGGGYIVSKPVSVPTIKVPIAKTGGGYIVSKPVSVPTIKKPIAKTGGGYIAPKIAIKEATHVLSLLEAMYKTTNLGPIPFFVPSPGYIDMSTLRN